MAKLTMVLLYVSGSVILIVGLLAMIASFSNQQITFGQAFAVTTIAALIMGLGAVIQTLREISSKISAEQRLP